MFLYLQKLWNGEVRVASIVCLQKSHWLYVQHAVKLHQATTGDITLEQYYAGTDMYQLHADSRIADDTSRNEPPKMFP